jgi:hypothetical protein
MTNKALILSAAVVLAACSRNPEPRFDETGRADTTIVADTALDARVDTTRVDTTEVLPMPDPQPTPDSLPQPQPQPHPEVQPSPTPTPYPSKDTSRARTDTTVTGRDSVQVSHEADKFEGDSAMIERNVPDSMPDDSTGDR